MTANAIVIADGDGTRWGDYGGRPKHLAEVDGEPILHRTVRLLQRPDVQVWVVGPDDDRYRVPGSNLYVPVHDLGVFDADKFLNSRQLWHPDGRTLVVYGDVYFTDAAMTRILDHPSGDWTLFARPFASALTGTPYGECFAQSWGSHDTAEHHAALRRIVDLYQRGIVSRCGGWEHYRAMLHLPDQVMGQHLVGDRRLAVIDDWTDDIDHPYDYDRLIVRRQEAGL